MRPGACPSALQSLCRVRGEMRFEKRAADLIKRLFVLLVTAPPQDARGLQCDTCSPLGNRKGWEPFLVALKWLC